MGSGWSIRGLDLAGGPNLAPGVVAVGPHPAMGREGTWPQPSPLKEEGDLTLP